MRCCGPWRALGLARIYRPWSIFSIDTRGTSLRGNAHVVFCGLAQDIAAAPYGFDEVLAVRCVGEFLAQLADEHIDDLELRLVHAAVEVVEKHLLCQRCAFA